MRQQESQELASPVDDVLCRTKGLREKQFYSILMNGKKIPKRKRNSNVLLNAALVRIFLQNFSLIVQ